MPNSLKTILLLGVMTGLLLWAGNQFGGQSGLIIAFIFAIGMNVFGFWFSDKIVLKMYRAKEVDESSAPELYRLVGNLATQASLPMPKVYIVPMQEPNAFATGRNPNHAAVAVTEGIMRLMSYDELCGVIAHELAHIKNRDILIGTISAILAGTVMMLATMARWGAIFGGFGDDEDGGGIIELLVLAIVTPIVALIIQMAISRTREYKADATGAQIAGNPFGLANGLEKLSHYSGKTPAGAQHPSTAHMMIMNPLSGKGLMQLLSTHPPIEKRIEKLRTIG